MGQAVSGGDKTVEEIVASYKARLAATTQPSRHHTEAPPGYVLRGVSTLLGADGSVKQSWVKTARDINDPEQMLRAFELMAVERIRPVELSPPPVSPLDVDSLAVYPFGDPHVGMLSWHLETGEDFDLKIARDIMTKATRHLVALMPATETALVVSVGDYFHTDNLNNRTTRGDHQLDVDSRLMKVVRVGVETFIDVIDLALLKHRSVHVIAVPGNHDTVLSGVLSIMLALYYRNEPRVTVDMSPSLFRYYEFGKCLFGVTHGHTVKLEQLPEIMAVDQAEAWGRTLFRHFYTGHVHHTQVKDLRGCTAQSLRTLASPDAYNHSHGYRSRRSMTADVWHRELGILLSHTVGIESLRGAA